MVKPGPGSIPLQVRGLALGLLLGVGGAPLSPRKVSALIKERFNIDISPRTLQNWVPKIPEIMKKYGITDAFIEETVLRVMVGKKIVSEEIGKVDSAGRVNSDSEDEEDRGESAELPEGSIAESVSRVEKEGFIVVKGLEDMIALLEQKGMTVLGEGQLQVGPQILSWEPVEIDFEALGKTIAMNPIIAWYFALYRKLCQVKGEEPPSREKFVTDCVIDTMTRRDWWMAVLRGRPL